MVKYKGLEKFQALFVSAFHKCPDDFLRQVAGAYVRCWLLDDLAILINSDRSMCIFLRWRNFIEYFDFSNYATKAGVRFFYPVVLQFSALFAPLFCVHVSPPFETLVVYDERLFSPPPSLPAFFSSKRRLEPILPLLFRKDYAIW